MLESSVGSMLSSEIKVNICNLLIQHFFDVLDICKEEDICNEEDMVDDRPKKFVIDVLVLLANESTKVSTDNDNSTSAVNDKLGK